MGRVVLIRDSIITGNYSLNSDFRMENIAANSAKTSESLANGTDLLYSLTISIICGIYSYKRSELLLREL